MKSHLIKNISFVSRLFISQFVRSSSQLLFFSRHNKLKIISRKLFYGRDNCINEISNNFEKINEIRNMRRWKQRAKSITEGDEKWWRWKGKK